MEFPWQHRLSPHWLLICYTMLLAAAPSIQAQKGEDRSGIYYIANYNNGSYSATNLTNNFYLCPATVYYDGNGYQTSGDMPYVTTDKTSQSTDSKWQVTFAKTIDGVDYYHIQHVESEKYLTLNDSKTANDARIRLHLQADLATNGDELFYFVEDATRFDSGSRSSFAICPKNDSAGRSLNPAGDNYASRAGTSNKTEKVSGATWNVGGLIGLWAKNDARSTWFLDEKLPRPTITLNGSGQVEMSCTEAGTVIHYTTDGTAPTADSPTYSGAFAIPVGTSAVKAIAVRTADGEVSNIVTLQLPATFHVVNRQNAIALSYSGSVKALASVPAEIRSPYIPGEAGYKLFGTQADAYAYTAATSDADRATAAAAATTITAANQTVYVGYYYDEAQRPADLPVLDGLKWYQMMHHQADVVNYFYSNLNANRRPESSNIASTTSDAAIAGSDYLWHFTGNDPYDIRMANKAINDVGAATAPGEWLVKQNATITDNWYRTMVGYHKDDGASMVMLRHESGGYNLAIVSDGSALGNRQYLFFFGTNGQNNANVRFFRNDKEPPTSPLYVSDRPGCRLTFSEVTADYTFHIVDRSGRIAISHTVTGQPVGMPLNSYTDIPEAIRSHYLEGERVSFYSFSGSYSTDKINADNQITETPLTNADIYVTYTADHLMDKFLHLRGIRIFNITANGHYLYNDNGTLSTASAPSGTELGTLSYKWTVRGLDPYAVQVVNADGNLQIGYDTTHGTLTLQSAPTDCRFILIEGSSRGDGTYGQMELMAATGNAQHYTLSRTDDDGLTLGTAEAAHADALQVRIYTTTRSVEYWLIDKAGELIEGPIANTSEELLLPEEWRSPLVSTYHFHKTATVDANGIYTVGDEITSLIDLGNQNTVYVTYDAGNALDIEGGTTYLLKFAHGTEMYQEDGKDYIETRKTEAIYPYNNGDHNLFVHGQVQWQEQLAQGASTRARWLWYLVSHHNGTPLTGSNVDPYHVVVKSYSNQSIKVGDVPTDGNTYLYTYKPSEDVGVTTGVISDHSGVTEQPTEYMLIGASIQHMKLKTRYEVEGQRRIVDRFEHYWKNNPLANKLLEDSGVGNVTANEENVTLTAAQRSFLESAQPALNKDAWHSYEAWAYAAPWAQRTDGTTNKKLEKKEHWFQTVGMGTGDFTVEAIELAPVLILLDQHGWEIVRIVLPHGPDDPDRAARYAALHQYNSPMVERYHYWKTGEKVSGYHKYVVSNYAIDGEGNEYTSNELGVLVGNVGNLPDYATQGLQDDKERDWYVTYDVKPRYATSYVGAATETATIPSSFLLIQGGSYATTTDGNTISTTGKPTDMDNIATETLWLLQPNFNIDREMGYKYAGEEGAQEGALSKAATDQENYDESRNGFDPYNLQIRNKAYPQRYLTANTTGSRLSGGAWAGTSSALTLEYYNQARQTATSYDHVKPSISNTTFMVIDDGNGNMRLMPRFDNTTVMTSFTMLAAQNPAAEAGDPGDGTQTITFGTTTKEAHSTDEILDMTAEYKLAADFRIYNPIGTSTNPFRGTIDGQLYVIEDVTKSLVGHADGATIKNVMLDNVTISSGTTDGNVGAICNEAKGATRIYNCGILATESTVEKDESGYDHISSCSSTVSGTNYVGGIVGLLDEEARVINCFSYANVSGGSYAGGIVGYNNVATTATNLKTMVMNCMFYGEVSGSSIAPIYNGEIITNDGDADGVNNFNYFRLESSYIENTTITKVYNCALGAETRFLQRFEFYRHLLNSNRELAAWWATGSTNNKNEMMKWVLEPSQIGSSAPYPILKAPYDDDSKIIKYNSVVNIDAENAPLASERNKGGKMGTLSVTIQSGNGDYFNAPLGASITKSSLTLNITDKDFDHFNFNYYKVQLPYYNEVGTGNYTGNRVVTGWKIVSVTTDGSVSSYNTFTTGDDAPAYNFADRKCTAKDIYSKTNNKRVFNQGAYWDVPEGVTGITIEPYWGNAVYLSDAYWDVTYQNSGTDAMATALNVETVGGGQRYGNDETFNSQTVYTDIGSASTALYAGTNEATYSARSVYDYAVVLVGNYHHYGSIAGGGKPYTLTSVDMDGDNEPDYSLMLRFDGRTVFHPVRYDFLNLVGLGMAQKTTGGTGSYNFGIMQPRFWFEVTNTALLRVTQFEYDRSNRGAVPYIVQGGVIEQWVSGQNNGAGNNTTYFHVGGNVWFKEFHRGTHQDKTLQSKHPPVSVTGGDYDEFYLTGLYTANVTSYEDNAECYINGGRFGVVAGAAMEGIGKADGADDTGNITWQVQNADIKEFYAGGINADKPVTGNLSTTITGGKIDLYCGGPKFGDMSPGKTVTTDATDCIFGTFFGAGYGGNSYSRRAPKNHNNIINFPHNDGEAGNDASWNAWLSRFYQQSYNATYGGVSTQFSNQFLPMSGNVDNCARIFVDYVKFSLATTRNVTSTLNGCTITNNFYGGGSLGKVEGPVTSTLDGCTVVGNVFGAGYSASLPTVEVDSTGFRTEPYYYTDLGTYRTAVKGATTTYTWEHAETVSSTSTAIDNTNHILYTEEDLTTLGTVTGDVALTITGNDTYIGGSVFGGGDESSVSGNTTVSIDAGKTLGNVYGGGNVGSVGTFTKADATYIATHPEVAEGKPLECTEGGKTTVTISGTAEIGRDGMSMTAAGGPDDYGHVFGAGRGTVDPLYDDDTYQDRPITDPGKQTAIATLEANDELAEKLTALEMLAYVNETEVTISEQAFVKGSVYGGSENGHVLGNTWVKIEGGQVGCGKNTTERFPEAKFAADYTLGDDEDMECSHWDYTYPYRPHDIFAGTKGYDSKDGHKISSDGHTFYGNVFGGGSGYYPYAPGKWLRSAGRVEGNTKVEVTGGHILTSLYGGNEMTDVEGFCEIIMSGGTLGVPRSLQQIREHPVTCYVFGAGKGDQRVLFNQWTNVDSTKVTIKGTARIYGSVFGGGEDGHVLGNTKVTIGEKGATNQPTIGNWGTSYVDGNIFGGGRGFGGDALTAGGVCGNVTIDILGGNMLGSIYGGGRLGSVGMFLVPATITDPNDPTATIENPRYGQMISDDWEQVIGGDSIEATGVTHGHITINISGGTIGNTHEYTYYAPDETIDKDADNIPLTEFDYRNHVLYTKGGNVFTGCMGRLDALDGSLLPNWKDMAKAKSTTLNITGGTIKSNVYGGAELGTVTGNTTINITGGTIGTKIGTGTNAYYYGNVYGGGKGSTDSRDANNIHIAGQVGGNVNVDLNRGVATDAKGGVVRQIFGCNDMNGSPLGTVTVHVYATQNEDSVSISSKIHKGTDADTGTYDVVAVYGGGNLAAYKPTKAFTGSDEEKLLAYPEVIIEGCEVTSIGTVYGGGNAASTPATKVTVKSAYEIGKVFGGGNGQDKLPTGAENPGANVGYLAYSYANDATAEAIEAAKAAATYGSGKAHATILGGTVHEVYGGSNTKGNVRVEARTTLDDEGECPFNVGEAFGGGRKADMDGDAVLEIKCISGLGKAFGGAAEADINGDVVLNITNGTYGQVFGGNDKGGNISGSITVNIEEIGCNPIIIGELYGGGNEAAYTAPTGIKSPVVNVKSFTSIGTIFGGGYGAAAEITGNPTVNIDVVTGIHKETVIAENSRVIGSTVKKPSDTDYDATVGFAIPSHAKDAIGAIGTVFGGGNEAKVIGNTTVNIGTLSKVKFVSLADDASTANVDESEPDVVGVDIRGNVFGGGNQAEVNGNTNVVVGKKQE